jgi:hypothetical protein
MENVDDGRFCGAQKGTAGLGLRNRAQRLLEYGERRAAVLGLHTRTCYTQRPAGRKRRRGWIMPSLRRMPNAINLWTISEDDGLGGMEIRENKDETRSYDTRTVVFGSACGSMQFG